MQLYDLTKRGTIVVGHMRSGSHYLANLVKQELAKNNIEESFNAEYFRDIFGPISQTPDKYSFFNIIDRLKEQDVGQKYSIGTMVYPGSLDLISQHKGNYEYLMSNYHVIKLIRKNLMEQLMSFVVFGPTAKHNSITSLDDMEIKIPVTLTNIQLMQYMHKLLELERFHTPNVIFYEDLPHNPLPNMKKNNYGLTPAEFFSNYDYIVKQLKQLNITHYEW